MSIVFVNTVVPCPFCGCMEIILCAADTFEIGLAFDSHLCSCSQCNATGPTAHWSREHPNTKVRARELWEQRVHTS